MINFYDKRSILLENHILQMLPDIYLTPEYGECCEYSDDAIWELCHYKDLIYVYLKKEIMVGDEKYYDLITPYGYSGYHFKDEKTFEQFILLFRSEAKKKNYLTEVVRQNPYLSIKLKKYDSILSRPTFGIVLKKYQKFDNYLEDTSKCNQRAYRNGCKKNLVFKMNNYSKEDLEHFIDIYEINMIHLKSKPYYYFNKDYYEKLYNLKNNVLFANVYIGDKLISSCMILRFNKMLHYHIGGSLLEYRNYNPNNYLHCKVIEYGIKYQYELYHLGGGITDNDSLSYFKKRISNNIYEYIIYKNILNQEVYNKLKQQYPNTLYFPVHRE